MCTLTAGFLGCAQEAVEPEVVAPEEPPARAIGAGELYAAYENDEQAADEEFDDQRLEVHGIVRSVGFTETNTGVALLVQDQLDRKPKIECTICGTMGDGREYGNFDDMDRLAPRQQVVIRGICKGFSSFNGPYLSLDDCELIHLEPAPPPVTSPLDGSWVSEDILYEGKPDNWLKKTVWEIRGDEIYVTDYREDVLSLEFVERGVSRYDAWLTIDPLHAPHRITFETDGPNRTIIEVFGIFKLEGDTLTVCYSDREERRPTEFESPPDSFTFLLVFKRQYGD